MIKNKRLTKIGQKMGLFIIIIIIIDKLFRKYKQDFKFYNK